MNERAGRQEAVRRGLRVAGTLFVLDEAEQAELVDFDDVVVELQKTSLRISPAGLSQIRSKVKTDAVIPVIHLKSGERLDFMRQGFMKTSWLRHRAGAGTLAISGRSRVLTLRGDSIMALLVRATEDDAVTTTQRVFANPGTVNNLNNP